MTSKDALKWLFLKASKQHGQLWAIKLTKPYDSRKKLVDEITSDLDNHGGELNDTFHIVDKALTELEELKKRDMAMKLTQASRFTTDKKLYGMYACNNCHEVIPYFTLNSKRIKPGFCPHCGQRLDWEELK